MYSVEQFETLVESVYDASVDEAQWPAFLAKLAQQLNGVLPTLFLHDTRTHSGALAINVGYDEATVSSYRDHFATRNLWLRSGTHLLQPGSVRTSHIMCSRQVLLASEWYADYCRPLAISQGIGATIHKDSVLTSNVAIFAGDERTPFGGEDIAFLKALMPHMQRALKVHLHVAEADLRKKEFVEAMEPLAVGVILVAANGQILFANRMARALFRKRDALIADRNGLRAVRSHDSTVIRTLIAAAAKTFSGQARKAGGTLKIQRPKGRSPIEVMVSPIARDQRFGVAQCAVAALYVTDPESIPERPETELARLHGLTPAEAHVATLIARGRSGRQVADELAISYNTVKSHLKKIFAKTGTRRQGELIRFMVNRAAHMNSSRENG